MDGTSNGSAKVAESYAWCRGLARRTAGNFYYSFLTLPKALFADMCVLYAFMRVSDDLGDDPGRSLDERRAALDQWERDLQACLAGDGCDHRLFPALREVVQRHQIPRDLLRDVLAGVRTDLGTVRFDSFSQLADYCYLVAGAVGRCCLYIWGFKDARALDLAVDCGVAFQLTNILRDLGEDSRAGRVYLPQEDLARFGYAEADLKAHVCDERFCRLMQFEVERAREYYRRSAALAELLTPPGRAIYAAMRRIYGGLLDRIERRGYDVFTSRIRLSSARKLWVTVGTTIRHRLLAGR